MAQNDSGPGDRVTLWRLLAPDKGGAVCLMREDPEAHRFWVAVISYGMETEERIEATVFADLAAAVAWSEQTKTALLEAGWTERDVADF